MSDVPCHHLIRDVVVIAPHKVSIFELSVAAEVFGIDRTADGVPAFDFAVVAEQPGEVRTKNGFGITTPYGLDRTETADIVIVPSWLDGEGVPSRRLLDALVAAADRGALVASFCSGAFVLGHAGLLDGRRATTHFLYAAKLAQMFPLARVDPDVLFVFDEPVVTSAGTSAAIDLCLQLVRDSDGAAVASEIARRMVVPPQRAGGQAQYVDRPLPIDPGDSAMAVLLDWVVGNLRVEHTVDDLAARVAMSSRTFARKFKEQTGTTPYRWILQQRIRAAQHLLEGTHLDIERIARDVGFSDATTLRLHFNRIVRTTPTAYRRTFQCPDTRAG